MEQKYGTQLFYRKPKVMLTPAGEAVQRTLNRIRIMEEGLLDEINEIENGLRGNLVIGMNSTRVKILFPEVFKQFHELYPNVNIDIILEETLNMEMMLLKGQLDFFVGIGRADNPEFKTIPLYNESIHLLISEILLNTHFPNDPELRRRFSSGVDLALFKDIPFVRNLPQSQMTVLIDQYLSQNNVKIKNIMSISDYDVQIALCLDGQVATFCPIMILQRVFALNSTSGRNQCLYIFPLKNMTSTLNVSIIRNAFINYPRYVKTFFNILRRQVVAVNRTLLQSYNKSLAKIRNSPEPTLS
jgi:DNA-binding transcriptional LysR family regulator